MKVSDVHVVLEYLHVREKMCFDNLDIAELEAEWELSPKRGRVK